MSDCLFCRIAAGEIPSKKVYENDKVLAFHDINPQAPVHVLVIPKVHIDCANSVDASNSEAVSAVFEAIPEIARLLGINSYSVINNCGPLAGQTVMHLHFHILSGREMGERLV